MISYRFSLTLFLFSFSIFVQSCSCGIDDANRFHAPLRILFELEDGIPQIGPLGDFEIESSQLYNEENELIDSSFFIVEISDWNIDWNEDNISYERNYDLALTRKSNNTKENFKLDITYVGEINRCDSYEINEIKISVNDSTLYKDFFMPKLFLKLDE